MSILFFNSAKVSFRICFKQSKSIKETPNVELRHPRIVFLQKSSLLWNLKSVNSILSTKMCQIVKIICETFDKVILYFFTIPKGKCITEEKKKCQCCHQQKQPTKIDNLEDSFVRDLPPLGKQSSGIDQQLENVGEPNRQTRQDLERSLLTSTKIFSDSNKKRGKTKATVPVLGQKTRRRSKPASFKSSSAPAAKRTGRKLKEENDDNDVWYDAETSFYYDAEGHPENFLHPHIRREQDYNKILEECLKKGTVFEDPDFPATDASLMFSGAPQQKYEWLRPKEICKRPVFFGNDISRCNVLQGELGNCWVVAALALMAECPELLYKVAPQGQDFGDKYRGVFHFRFWKYGKWIDVVVDDRLPCAKRKLVYAHSADPNEFWVALLEKAYAKMNGSYEALRSGTLDEALVDFTGGCSERFNPRICRPGFLFSFLRRSNQMQSLMGCSVQEMYAPPEKLKEEGILANHVYSITKVYEIVIEQQNPDGSPNNISIPMIRLRNPYGAHGAEWRGTWCDGAEEWEYVSDDQKQAMEVQFQQDGEFWMSFDDFEERFDNLEVVNLTPDALRRKSKIPWFCSEAHGQWASGITAGGMETDSETFPQNPQYRINLRFVDVDDPCGNCTMCITLMQKYRRATRAEGTDILAIGFFVYHLDKTYRKMCPVPKEFFKACPIRATEMFRYGREISLRVRLPRGVYLIIPATAYPNEDGEFLLRVFSSAAIDMCEHDRPMLIRDPPIKDDVEEETEKCVVVDKKKCGDIVEMSLEMFRKLEEVEIGWKKLKDIMNAFAADMPNFQGFSKETVRSAATLVDENRNGKIDIHELEALIKKLIEWRAAFENANTDKTGILEPFHLGPALDAVGFKANRATLIMLRRRYGRDDGSFHFDDFIMCTIKLTSALDAFKRRRVGRKQTVEFRMEDWLHTTIFS